ncbi:hypothetical protein NDU88_007655 [Pleurodeles waltl]|uniref:Uncharacterized protein n=1 Tax=Pleurodeles waltl TaxID=8319 RepID=A0AAV7U0Z7_PLEWA|nr:hypothetical protein NDU88_007655 [Pleurodeles waltl]
MTSRAASREELHLRPPMPASPRSHSGRSRQLHDAYDKKMKGLAGDLEAADIGSANVRLCHRGVDESRARRGLRSLRLGGTIYTDVGFGDWTVRCW